MSLGREAEQQPFDTFNFPRNIFPVYSLNHVEIMQA